MSNTLFYSLCALGGLLGALAAWHTDLYHTFVTHCFLWSCKRCFPVRVYINGGPGEPYTLILGKDIESTKEDALRYATSNATRAVEKLP